MATPFGCPGEVPLREMSRPLGVNTVLRKSVLGLCGVSTGFAAKQYEHGNAGKGDRDR